MGIVNLSNCYPSCYYQQHAIVNHITLLQGLSLPRRNISHAVWLYFRFSLSYRGTVTYEWMEGGFFLVQHLDLDHAGHKIKRLSEKGCDQSGRAGAMHGQHRPGGEMSMAEQATPIAARIGGRFYAKH